MGLDIHVYSKMKKAPADVVAAVMEAECPGTEAEKRGLRLPWIHPDFPGREEGIERAPYAYEGDWHFRAGSYSGPFAEFLYFSDCQGTIGPVVAAKLAKDFADFEEKAKAYEKVYGFWDTYQNWKEAFELASGDGCVVFC